MTPPPADDLTPLLAESAWLHRLARRLVGEPGTAADLAQDTLLAAWRRPPAPGVAWRTWLVGILRHLLQTQRRSEQRRRTREATAPLPAGAEDPARTHERLDAHARLVAAVQALDEPYRTTVMLRFLDDLPVEQVAARTGVPNKTVYTRLERALERLRERLDRDFGRRAAWTALLLPTPSLPVPPWPASGLPELATTTPILAMSTTLKWALPTAALAVVGLFAASTLMPDAPAAPQRAAAAPAPQAEAAAPDEPAPASTPDRSAVAAAPTAPAPAAAAAAAPEVRGFVRDVDGRGLAGLDVVLNTLDLTVHSAGRPRRLAHPAPPTASTRSGTDGAFVLPPPKRASAITANGPGLATVLPATLTTELPPAPVTVVVGPARDYAGVVLDTAGRPLAGAELGVSLPRDLVRALTGGLAAAGLPLAEAISDAEGRFVLPTLGHAPGLRLAASAAGHHAAQLDLPPEGSTTLELRLAPRGEQRGRCEGRVEFADGRPAAGALVALAGAVATADAEGRFGISPPQGATCERITAAYRGCLPATFELVGVPEARWRDLVLVLGAEARTIAGVVLDAAGAPIAGAKVWTPDGDDFGEIDTRIGQVRVNLRYDVEGILDGTEDGQQDGRSRRTDAEGRFRLTGLGEREYRLWALVPGSHELVGPVPVRSGATTAVLTATGRERRTRVAGVVTSFGGLPIVGARVAVDRSRPLGGVPLHASDDEEVLRTDAEGRFEFAALCIEHTSLAVTTDDAPTIRIALAEARDLTGLQVRVPQRCFLQVALTDRSAADSIGVEDEHGKYVELQFELGGVRLRAPILNIGEGIGDRLALDERGRVVVLKKGQTEVARLPVVLKPGEVVVVGW